jgi:adenosine deaminase
MPLIKKPSYIGVDSFLTNYNIVLDLAQTRVKKQISYDINSLFKILERDLNGMSINSLDIDTSLNFLKDKLISKNRDKRYLYKLFNFLSTEHFYDSDGKIVLNINNIDEFQSLVNSVDMTPIYATAVDSYISHYSHRDKSSYIKESINNTILSYPSRFNFLSMVSDNHFHLGGALHISYRLNEILKNPFNIANNRPKDRELDIIEQKSNLKLIVWSASIFEKIIYTYLIKKDFYKDELLHRHINNWFQYLTERILDNNILYINNFKNNNFHFISFREKIINRELFNQKNYRNTLISNIYYSHQKGELQRSDKLFWLLIIDYLKEGNNYVIMDIIYLYTILRNVIRRYIIQQHFKEGLIYFSSVSRSDARRSKIRQEYLDSFRSIFLPNFNINIEGRINFQNTQRGLAQEMHNWLESFLIVEYENTQQIYKENQLSFILHFQKKEEKKEKINIKRYDKRYSCRFKDYRVDIFKKTETFLKFLRSPDYKRYKIPIMTSENLQRLKRKFHDLDCLEKLEKKEELSSYERKKLEKLKQLNLHKHLFINKKYCQNGFISAVEVDLTRYISGIDAASREHTTPPEVFAPVFNYIRSSMEISRISFENRVNVESYDDTPKHFQFTFHVGEDFRDILTGIRHVVEAVLFLGLKKGDRIGHALALGLMHKQWARKKRRVFTSKQEQFDNAVFAYFILSLFSDYRELKKDFHQKALQLGNEIYQADFTIDNYINSWLLRRNCPVNLKVFLDRFEEQNQEQLPKEIEEIIQQLGYGHFIHNKIDNFYQRASKRCAKSSIEADDREYQIKNFRHLTQSKLYFEKSMPDLFKYRENYKDELSKRYEWARTDTSAWEIYLRYHYDRDVKKRGKKKIDEPMRKAEYTEILQDLILENIIAKRDIIIEAMPSSNVLNSYIEDYHNHPIFRFKPVDSFEDFNKYGIRKTPIRIIINTDNPGFQATSYINELFLIHNAGLKLGYSPEKIEQYIKEIVELGNSIFENRASQE